MNVINIIDKTEVNAFNAWVKEFNVSTKYSPEESKEIKERFRPLYFNEGQTEPTKLHYAIRLKVNE